MHQSAPATGLTSCDQRHPGCGVSRPTRASPARLTSSNRQFPPSRTSSGVSNATCSMGCVVAAPSGSARRTTALGHRVKIRDRGVRLDRGNRPLVSPAVTDGRQRMSWSHPSDVRNDAADHGPEPNEADQGADEMPESHRRSGSSASASRSLSTASAAAPSSSTASPPSHPPSNDLAPSFPVPNVRICRARGGPLDRQREVLCVKGIGRCIVDVGSRIAASGLGPGSG
jgi:hypothetical protein